MSHAPKRSVTVEVAGQKLTLKTDAEEAYVRSLADYVSEKIGEAKATSRAISTHNLAILAAMNIADDLFQAQRGSDDLKRRVRDKSRTILDLIDRELKPVR